MYDFSEKRVLVTGASQGIGECLAKSFADCGAKVALLSRHVDKLQKVKKKYNSLRLALIFGADVRDEKAVGEVVSSIEENWGGIDILINNAGGSFRAAAKDLSPNGFAAVMNINLLGPFIMAKAVFPFMETQGNGVILNTGSVAGRESSPGMIAYGASKAGLVNMTRTLAAEWGPHGIRINTIAPGPILTDAAKEVLYQNSEENIRRAGQDRSVGRLGLPEDVAGAALYLASPDSSFINGETLYVDGGPGV